MKDIFEHNSKLQVAANPYTLTQTSEAFSREITGAEILGRVIDYLISKGLHERMEQGEYNKSTLGNVQFWINNIRNANKSVIKSELRFSNTCEEWNLESILMSIEEAERNLLIQQGVSIDANYKPIN